MCFQNQFIPKTFASSNLSPKIGVWAELTLSILRLVFLSPDLVEIEWSIRVKKLGLSCLV